MEVACDRRIRATISRTSRYAPFPTTRNNDDNNNDDNNTCTLYTRKPVISRYNSARIPSSNGETIRQIDQDRLDERGKHQ